MARRKIEDESTQNKKLVPKKVRGYKLLGNHFKSKIEANSAIVDAHRKGFKSTGLCVINGEFVVRFGTYTQMKDAEANLAAVQAIGFTAKIEEITE